MMDRIANNSKTTETPNIINLFMVLFVLAITTIAVTQIHLRTSHLSLKSLVDKLATLQLGYSTFFNTHLLDIVL